MALLLFFKLNLVGLDVVQSSVIGLPGSLSTRFKIRRAKDTSFLGGAYFKFFERLGVIGL